VDDTVEQQVYLLGECAFVLDALSTAFLWDVVYFGESIQKWGRKAVVLVFISACFIYQTKFYVDTKNINNNDSFNRLVWLSMGKVS